MGPTACPAEPDLLRLVTGGSSGEVPVHVLACDRCRAALRRLASEVRSLRRVRDDPSPPGWPAHPAAWAGH